MLSNERFWLHNCGKRSSRSASRGRGHSSRLLRRQKRREGLRRHNERPSATARRTRRSLRFGADYTVTRDAWRSTASRTREAGTSTKPACDFALAPITPPPAVRVSSRREYSVGGGRNPAKVGLWPVPVVSGISYRVGVGRPGSRTNVDSWDQYLPRLRDSGGENQPWSGSGCR